MSLFEPKSIAVIGASASEEKVGHLILKNLIEEGFAGSLYPINPKEKEILGKTAYASIADVPEEVEMAVVVTPASTVCGIAKECGKKGVTSLVVISAGFNEMHTTEGKKMEEELVRICEEYEMDLVGPNCLGLMRPSTKMNASFGKELPKEGGIALVSQSGAMITAILDGAPTMGMGFSVILSIGNKSALSECDYMERCAEDAETKVIGLYLENIADGRRFMEVAHRTAQTKPIVLLKSGISAHGKQAASSHTGALAGSDAAVEAVCKQTGVHRAHDLQEFLALLHVLSTQPPLLSANIAVITNAGGPGILATDAAEAAGLRMPALSEKTKDRLRPYLPDAASLGNPTDVIGDATTDRYKAALDICNEDPSIDGLVVLLTPQVMTPCTEIAEMIVDSAKQSRLMPIVTSFMGGECVQDAVHILAEKGIPNFATPEAAVHAMAALQKKECRELAPVQTDDARRNKALGIMEKRTGLLPEDVTEKLLDLYNIPLPQQGLARTATEARKIAGEIGYPVVAKISSPEILHKTDVGGIRANLKDEADVAIAFEEIVMNAKNHKPDADIKGVLIQKFLPVGNEFILGALRDPSFGPMVMVGLGGIYTELFKDASFRIAPFAEEEAYHMLQELKGWKLLLGMRGARQADIDALVQAILSVSHLMLECGTIQEIDFNPVMISDEVMTFADAKLQCM
ncbi:acyl-CoA synthetase [Candidatus Peregrinibacteria bacterium CG10_big_fil_rev_8_21_14_0_10_49_10]|nr:MAG: acyl-CoA synthetase [Candidatus Peregrinibacteria bacterium CG10_big_fil_rev_8_21_14_0_10_49_10]